MNETPNDPYLPKLHELLTSQKNLRCRLLATLSRPSLEDLDRSVAEWFGLPCSLKIANRTKELSTNTVVARSIFVYLACAEFYYPQRLVEQHLQMSYVGVRKRLITVKTWLEDKDFAEKLWKFKQKVKKQL